jgi:steroid delta-isomerase-like uncharacterized protein
MSIDLKKFVHQWFDEVWNQGQESAIEHLMATHVLAHGLSPEGSMQGRDVFKQFFRGFHQAFPDIHISVEDVVVEGDMAAYRSIVTGTHLGAGLGVAPTNKPIQITGMGFVVVKGGEIIEGWNNFDFLTLYQQIGLIEIPQSAPASTMTSKG